MRADAALLSRVSRDVQQAFRSQGFGNFSAQWLFIATWHNVTYFGASIHSRPVRLL